MTGDLNRATALTVIPEKPKLVEIIPGAKVLNMGATGTGKTHSLRTLLDCGLEVFGIITEPNGLIVLGPVLDKINYTYIGPVAQGWDILKTTATSVNRGSAKSLASGSGNKLQHTQFLDVVSACANFKDIHGKEWGCVSDWSTDRVLFLDSLTGLTKMARSLCVGDRVSMSLPEYGIVQSTIEAFLDQVLTTCKCHFVLIAHSETTKDEVLGGVHYNVASIGNKLSPRIPVNFNDFIQSYVEAGTFYWRTTADDVDLKTNNLPRRAKIFQDYVPLVNAWKANGGTIVPTT